MTNRRDNGSKQARQSVAAALKEAGLTEEVNQRRGTITPNAQVVLERRYLSKDRSGNVLEDNQGMFRRVAHNLSQADLNYGATEEERQRTEDRFYQVMSRLELLPNSPTLMNAGRELQQLSACFVLPVEDSLEGIFNSVKHTGLIHKSGGGTGFAFSRVRPEGDVVGSTGGVASGPVSFIRAFDTATDVVKQGGTRRGANMGILDVTHPDILKFIRSKESGQALENFNISVAVSDEFMEKVKENENYELVNPRSGEKTRELNAREVFELLARMAWQTGDPGLVFIDAINKDNPNPQLGRIESTNPCGEQPLQPYESCNLASINLARMVRFFQDENGNEDAEIDWDTLHETVDTAVHLLDNVIDMNRYPIPEIEAMTKQTRRIGLGVMGLADLLVIMGAPYDSEEGLDLAGAILSTIHMQAHHASRALAEKRGAFPAWENSAYRQKEEHPDNRMRNSAPTTIAPTGTISIIAGVSSGIEPLFALAYQRNVMDNTLLIEGNPFLEAVARHEGFYSQELMAEVARTGSLAETGAPQWVKDIFRTSHDIHPDWHVQMQSRAQMFVDNAVSKTINFPSSATPEDIARAYMMAYDTGCKGITVYRDGSKEGQVLSTSGDNTHNGHDEKNAEYVVPRDRPQTVQGVTERVRTGHGNMYVTINFDEDGKPFEVFGNLGKAGGCDSAQLEAMSRLASLALRSNIDPEEVLEQMRGITCCPAWDGGMQVRSSPDAMAIAVRKHLHNGPDAPHKNAEGTQLPLSESRTESRNPAMEVRINDTARTVRKCPDCNGDVAYQEGCARCDSCGWSRCE